MSITSVYVPIHPQTCRDLRYPASHLPDESPGAGADRGARHEVDRRQLDHPDRTRFSGARGSTGAPEVVRSTPPCSPLISFDVGTMTFPGEDIAPTWPRPRTKCCRAPGHRRVGCRRRTGKSAGERHGHRRGGRRGPVTPKPRERRRSRRSHERPSAEIRSARRRLSIGPCAPEFASTAARGQEQPG